MSIDYWDTFKEAGEKALNEGNYIEAQGMWLAALEEVKDSKVNDPRLSASLENLAEAYWKQGRYEKAEPLCRRVVQIYEGVLGLEHPDVAVAANNLALVYERQVKYAEAAMLYQQALTILEKVLGPEHPDVQSIRENHTRARQLAQRQVGLKVDKVQGKWNKSGWWRALAEKSTASE